MEVPLNIDSLQSCDRLLPNSFDNCNGVHQGYSDVCTGEHKLKSNGDTPIDPWDNIPELQIDETSWSDLSTAKKIKKILFDWIIKLILLIFLLYLFICSLEFLSAAFRLLGGRSAGQAFSQNSILSNPVAGLMIGVLATVLVQSSSTSTSIIVSMVGSGLVGVEKAIPMVMGANIGTSVTNTIVSLAQAGNRNEFRRAFGGATVHDMFNWLSVFVLLPLEIASGYLFEVTSQLMKVVNFKSNSTENIELLSVITKPFTSLVIQLNKDVITAIAINDTLKSNLNMIKKFCVSKYISIGAEMLNVTVLNESLSGAEMLNITVLKESQPRCKTLFSVLDLNETGTGLVLLFGSLLILSACLICMVKILHSLLKGKIAFAIKKTVNFNFQSPFTWLAGYLALVVGALMTFLVQSSSIFTSALTPLVGIGVISLERMYPLTLGSNIGTTATGILASLAIPGTPAEVKHAIQIALCHLLFNITGILLWYPIPFLRKCPISLAKFLGNTTADYRWFAILYIIFMFFIIPGLIFLLSLISNLAIICTCSIVGTVILFIAIINIFQKYKPYMLPKILRNWEFLPLCIRSLQPLDSVISKIFKIFVNCGCGCQQCHRKLSSDKCTDKSDISVITKL